MRDDDFRKLYAEYSRPLYNYSLWLTGCGATAQDVLQTVFIKVWEQPTLPSAASALKAWLFTVCRNACMDTFRSRSRGERFARQYATVTPDHEPASQADTLLWRKIQALEETDRSIVYLHVKQGYEYAEIAGILHMTATNVRVRAFRALRRLRAEFTEADR